MNMTPLAWCAVAFGAFVSATIVAVLIYDPYAIASGRPTISQLTLEAAERWPWFAIVVTTVICAPVGALLGHLLYAHNGQGRPDAMLIAIAVLVVSFLLGHKYLGQ